MEKSSAFIFALIAAAGSVSLGCSAPMGGDDIHVVARELALAAAPTSSAASYVFQIGARSAVEVSDRAALLISTLTNTTVSADAIRSNDARADSRDRAVQINGVSLGIHYEPSFDMLTVINSAVADDYDSMKDVGVDVARQIFTTTLETLIDRGVADKNLEAVKAELETLKEGGAWMNEPLVERIKEYWFFVPLMIDGARVRKGNQEAGVRIAVNRDGRLSSLRVAGPISIRSMGTVARQVSDQDVETRLAADFPNSTIRRFGLSYVLDDAAGAEPILPRQAYYVGRRYTVQGRSFEGRAQVISYAVDNPSSAYRAWPSGKPDPAPGDAKPNP